MQFENEKNVCLCAIKNQLCGLQFFIPLCVIHNSDSTVVS